MNLPIGSKVYISDCLVKACPMDSSTFWREYVGRDSTEEGVDGYIIQFPSKRVSWMKKEDFEESFRILSSDEHNLVE